jgi:uncharacterized Fe-S cluster protein YjdI
MDKNTTKEYTTDEITIVWNPNICIHSRICFKGLGNVFNPTERPWIKPENATSQAIMAQIDKCPSGALSYYQNNETQVQENNTKVVAEITANGPLLVHGSIQIKHIDGKLAQQNKVTAFCRCGASANKPYCDGSHRKINFKG